MVDWESPVSLWSCPSESGTWIISVYRYELQSSDINGNRLFIYAVL